MKYNFKKSIKKMNEMKKLLVLIIICTAIFLIPVTFILLYAERPYDLIVRLSGISTFTVVLLNSFTEIRYGVTPNLEILDTEVISERRRDAYRRLHENSKNLFRLSAFSFGLFFMWMKYDNSEKFNYNDIVILEPIYLANFLSIVAFWFAYNHVYLAMQYTYFCTHDKIQYSYMVKAFGSKRAVTVEVIIPTIVTVLAFLAMLIMVSGNINAQRVKPCENIPPCAIQ